MRIEIQRGLSKQQWTTYNYIILIDHFGSLVILQFLQPNHSPPCAAEWVAESGESSCFKWLQKSFFKWCFKVHKQALKCMNIYQGMFCHHSNLRVVWENREQIRRVVWIPTEIVASFQTKCVTPPCVTPLESWEIGDVRLGACWQSQLSNLTVTTFKPSLNPAGKCQQAVGGPINTHDAALFL